MKRFKCIVLFILILVTNSFSQETKGNLDVNRINNNNQRIESSSYNILGDKELINWNLLIVIGIPNLVALIGVVIGFRNINYNVKGKIALRMYNDKLVAYRELNLELSRLIKSLEFILQLKEITKCTLKELSSDCEGIGDKTLYNSFMSAFTRSVLQPKSNFDRINEQNGLLYSKEVNLKISCIYSNYINILPNPIFPDLDDFLSGKVEILRNYLIDIQKMSYNDLKSV